MKQTMSLYLFFPPLECHLISFTSKWPRAERDCSQPLQVTYAKASKICECLIIQPSPSISVIIFPSVLIDMSAPTSVLPHLLPGSSKAHYRKPLAHCSLNVFIVQLRGNQHTSSIHPIRSAKHTLLFSDLRNLPLRAKLLPLTLPSLQLLFRFDFPRYLRRPYGPVADLTRLPLRLGR